MQQMMKWFDNFEEDSITNKIQRFQYPPMEVGFLLHNNNDSDTDITEGIFFNNTPTLINDGWEGYYSIHKHVILLLR